MLDFFIIYKKIEPYIKITRIDHNIKNIAVLPGIFFAIVILKKEIFFSNIPFIFFGICIVCLATSSNYVINEYLDKEDDSKHPYKKKRALISTYVNPKIIFFEYLILMSASIYLSFYFNHLVLFSIIVLLISGIIYNIKPFRTKEIAFLDTITESINNPIRFFLGWSLIDNNSIPPLSLMLGYYFLGAFLMNSKRLSEYKYFEINNSLSTLMDYRKSFKKYNTNNLLILSSLYSSLTLVFFDYFF